MTLIHIHTTAWQQQAIRYAVRSLFISTCSVVREVTTTDALGAQTHTTETVYSDLKCVMLPHTGQNSVSYASGLFGEQEVLREYHQMLCPHDTILLAGDDVVYQGFSYKVVQIRNHPSHELFVDVLLERIL